MAYRTWRPLLPFIQCDKCLVRLYKDDENRVFNSFDDADFAAADMGWHRYEQPDGDPRHICPECAKKEAMK